MKKQSRWKSVVLWTSIGSQIIAMLLFSGKISIADSQFYSVMLGMVLQILVTIGIINSPTDKDSL
jgi:uncharacterized membrane protein